jgi:hypothetical protein
VDEDARRAALHEENMRIASQGVSLDGDNAGPQVVINDADADKKSTKSLDEDAKSTKSQKADEPVKTDEELAKEAAEQDPLWKYTKEFKDGAEDRDRTCHHLAKDECFGIYEQLLLVTQLEQLVSLGKVIPNVSQVITQFITPERL